MTTNITNMHLAIAKASAFSSHEVSKSSIADFSSGVKGASCAKLKSSCHIASTKLSSQNVKFSDSRFERVITKAVSASSDTKPLPGLPVDLRGKRAFIAGIADDNGYGWAIAKSLAAAGAEILVGTWVPALNIFETSLRRGKFDESRVLPDGSLMEITKVYPLDAVYDTPEDVPEDVKTNKRYAGSSKWTVKEVAESVKEDFGSIDILVHSLANGPEVRPRSNIDSDDVTDRSPDVISPVKVVNSPNVIKDNDSKESKSSVHVEPEPESGTTDLCTSSTNSNSDSCSSCLSEGDGNASLSSTPQNTESSSTSDSECANHCSEVIKETSPCRENAGEMLSKTSESVTGNNVPPPLQAKSIHFPVFQAPSMGYYHQGPVPWASRPASGLMPLGPLSHPNHYLFASPFGYGNSPYVPYSVGVLQPPLLNHGQLPMYPSAPPVNGVKDHHTKVIPVKNEHVNSEKSQNGQNDNSEKTQKGNTGFSLFHFGGPVDVSNGFNPDTDAADCVKEEVDVDVDRSVVKDVEEYNLFAASNGIQFSIF